MKFPGNISYYLKPKQNKLLPNNLADLIDCNVKTKSINRVEEYAAELAVDKTELSIVDMGAGSKNLSGSFRLVSQVYKSSASSIKYCLFYQKLIEKFNIKNALELGTSLGVGTMSFAIASSDINVTTIEACPQTISFTEEKFNIKNVNNVRFINNTFDEVFKQNALIDEKFDLVFIDGNHVSESTIYYFNYISQNLAAEKCVFLFDDIDWTRDMHKAWKHISQQNSEFLRLNIGRIGVVFFGYSEFEAREISVKITYS